ncbi:MAG: glutamyl-tRNA(Gln) amidotransferase, subunit, partial [Pseudomonadota bacterium]
VRRLIAMDFDSAFESCDFIVGPVSPTVAWPIEGRSQTDPLAEYLADIYTLGASLAGLPAMSVPCGFQSENALMLPVGLQIIAPRFDEARLLAVAHAFQQQTDWHKQQAPSLIEPKGVAT